MFVMNVFTRYLLLWVAPVLACATASGLAQNSHTHYVPAVRQLELNGDLLTLAADSAPLHEVVREIGEIAGFETVLVGSFIESPLVSASFENLPLHEALERLVKTESRIVVYTPSAGNAGNNAIAQVWLLQAGTAAADMTLEDDQSIASGSKQDVQAYKLNRLIVMLQPDQAEFVRTRAAIALGQFQDERAVLALETALADRSRLVRLEAINALSRINSDQASTALRNFQRGSH